MDYNIRNAFQTIRDTRAECADSAGLPYSRNEIENTMTLEMILFIVYIISCDEITREDVSKLAFYTGMELTVYEIYDIIRDNGIADNTYEYTIPGLLNVMLQLDNILIDRGANVGLIQYLSLAYIQAFGFLAEDFYMTDGRVDFDRRENWDVFFKTLTDYVDSNLHTTKSEYDEF